jgi:type IV fimbrial biogenesis protein FimT
MQKQHGFTLVELMATVAISALMLSMAVPALDGLLSGARQTGAINDFVTSVHRARSTAITENTRVTLCPSSNGEDCEKVAWSDGWIAFADADSDQIVDASEKIISIASGTPGVTIRSPEFANGLLYRPNGRVTGDAETVGVFGSFTVCDNRGVRSGKVMIVDFSGRPRLSETNPDGTAPNCG